MEWQTPGVFIIPDFMIRVSEVIKLHKKSKNRHIMKILSNELATFKNLPLLKHLSWSRISLLGAWCCEYSATLCQGWQTAQWQCRPGKGYGSSCSWWNDGGSQLRWHAEPWAGETLAAGDPLRNKEEKVYKQIRIHSSKGDDLNIKGLRENPWGEFTLSADIFVNFYFFWLLCYAITDFNGKNDPSL